ncbi:MAG: beta-ribofuranosylaminobenzene 5'-phosphate synthase [Candidatus Hydrothermarchaeales archaeon]
MRIVTPSRVHITLIDLNASIGRMDGGIGLALEAPAIKIRARARDEISIKGPLKERAEDAAKRMLSALKIDSGIEVEIEDAYPQHIGLGSGTQLALAVSKAICSIYDVEIPVREMARIVGRGGTSGIGTAAFETGGFILDGGHSTTEKRDFLPSSASKAPPAPLLARYDFPDWKIVLVMPQAREISGGREVGIFKKYCPIPIEEVRELSLLVLMKVLPAVAEGDIVAFGDAVNQIQEIGFKRIEVDLQTQAVKELMHRCREHAYGVGLSSFGPTIYCVVEKEGELLDFLKEEGVEALVTKANNQGAIVKEL